MFVSGITMETFSVVFGLISTLVAVSEEQILPEPLMEYDNHNTVCYGPGTHGQFRPSCPNKDSIIAVQNVKVGTKPKYADCPSSVTKLTDHTGTYLVDQSNTSKLLNESVCCFPDESKDCISVYDYTDSGLEYKYHIGSSGYPESEPNLEVSWIETRCSTSEYPSGTNFMFAEYSCIEIRKIGSMCSNLSYTTTGNTFYLYNDGYPSSMKESVDVCRCKIQSGTGNLQVYSIDMRLEKYGNECRQTFNLTDSFGSTIWDCDSALFFNVTNITNSNSVSVSFNNDLPVDGGNIWISISGDSGETLTVDCTYHLKEGTVHPSTSVQSIGSTQASTTSKYKSTTRTAHSSESNSKVPAVSTRDTSYTEVDSSTSVTSSTTSSEEHYSFVSNITTTSAKRDDDLTKETIPVGHDSTTITSITTSTGPDSTISTSKTTSPGPDSTMLTSKTTSSGPDSTMLTGKTTSPEPDSTTLTGKTTSPEPDSTMLTSKTTSPGPNSTMLTSKTNSQEPDSTMLTNKTTWSGHDSTKSTSKTTSLGHDSTRLTRKTTSSGTSSEAHELSTVSTLPTSNSQIASQPTTPYAQFSNSKQEIVVKVSGQPAIIGIIVIAVFCGLIFVTVTFYVVRKKTRKSRKIDAENNCVNTHNGVHDTNSNNDDGNKGKTDNHNDKGDAVKKLNDRTNSNDNVDSICDQRNRNRISETHGSYSENGETHSDSIRVCNHILENEKHLDDGELDHDTAFGEIRDDSTERRISDDKSEHRNINIENINSDSINDKEPAIPYRHSDDATVKGVPKVITETLNLWNLEEDKDDDDNTVSDLSVRGCDNDSQENEEHAIEDMQRQSNEGKHDHKRHRRTTRSQNSDTGSKRKRRRKTSKSPVRKRIKTKVVTDLVDKCLKKLSASSLGGDRSIHIGKFVINGNNSNFSSNSNSDNSTPTIIK